MYSHSGHPSWGCIPREVNTKPEALIRTTGCTTKCRSSGRKSKSSSSAAPAPKRSSTSCYLDPEPEIRNLKPEIRDSNPESRIPKLYVGNFYQKPVHLKSKSIISYKRQIAPQKWPIHSANNRKTISEALVRSRGAPAALKRL